LFSCPNAAVWQRPLKGSFVSIEVRPVKGCQAKAGHLRPFAGVPMLTLERLLLPDMGCSNLDSARGDVKLDHTRPRLESDAGATPADPFGLRAINRKNVLL